MSLCWWCDGPADSREHKWPRALLVLEFGQPPDWSTEPVAHVYDGADTRVNGPRAKSLTFAPVICRKCNNDRSAPFDSAVIAFGRHVKETASELLRNHQLAWRAIDPETGVIAIRRNFTGFIVKFIGCCLAQARLDVPTSFRDFLNGDITRVPELHLVMSIRRDIADFLDYDLKTAPAPTGAVWSGGVTSAPDPDSPAHSMTFGHFTFRFARVSWTLMPPRNDGGTNFDHDVVEVPMRWNLVPDEYPWTLD